MLLAAFILPILVQAAPRWRVLLAPLNDSGIRWPAKNAGLGQGFRLENRPCMHDYIDPDLVERSAAVLKAYLDQTRRQVTYKPNGLTFESNSANESAIGSGRKRMSIEQALDVLGLESTASASEIREAHRRLHEKLDPLLGGRGYLIKKINEAKDILVEK